MPKEYSKEQLWKLYEKLPEELKEAVFSEETANSIYDICEKNKIEKISKVATYVGYVLLGILLIDEFQETLEKEVKLKEDVAKKVSQEVFRFIFFPVKSLLEELYKTEITPPAKPEVGSLPVKPLKTKSAKEEPSLPPQADTYRESIE